MAVGLEASAQTFTQYTTTEQQPWQTKGKVSLASKAKAQPILHSSLFTLHSKPFRAWGTCFNELDLDAIRLLTKEEQEKIMHDIFAPDGDLRFTRGRLTMNANDYSRAWYSCDTVAGDFALKYFNIEHDKANVIQLIKMAQKWQPAMTFWVSPWSPPSWMKINQDYCVASSPYNTQPKEKDYLLFDDGGQPDPNEMQFLGERQGLFPKKLASQNYFIQDPRYLQAYANMFCKFIDLYAEENIPIDMVMYQNEAYSYTPYPGCAWTAEGTIKFNKDYLAPTLKEKHPEVKLYVGTFNTNRQDYVEKIVSALTAPANSCVPSVASDQRSSAQFSILNSQLKKDTVSLVLNPDLTLGFYAKSLAELYEPYTREYGFFESIPAGVKYGWNVLAGYVGDMKYVFTADGAKSLGGFGAIGSLFPPVWDWYLFWKMTAFLSIILAFMNILPIPALDGGHVLFLIYEMITRRKPSETFMIRAEYVGFGILILLMVVANLNDILRWLGYL